MTGTYHQGGDPHSAEKEKKIQTCVKKLFKNSLHFQFLFRNLDFLSFEANGDASLNCTSLLYFSKLWEPKFCHRKINYIWVCSRLL